MGKTFLATQVDLTKEIEIEEIEINMIALEPTVTSARTARRLVADFLHEYGVDFRATTVLLASELVSNAVEHGGPHAPTATIELKIDARHDCVRVEVSDAGQGEPLIRNSAVNVASGRGLLIVQELSSRWGCDRLPVGKTVWFEILTPSGGDLDG